MSSNEERYEVSKRLRDLVSSSNSSFLHAASICNALGLVDLDRYISSAYYCGDSVMHLADIIEPERYITCNNVSSYGNNKTEENCFDFVCSNCGANLYPDEMGYSPLNFNDDRIAISYCPNCGAKVAE